MKVHWGCIIVFALLGCGSARPDTITTKDNLSINGSLLEMSNGLLTIKARFSSKEKEVRVPVNDIQSIEFNLLTSNPGAPPKILGIGPPADQNALQGEPPFGGVIVLRGGERQPCDLVSIDAERVHCNPNDKTHDRSAILLIVFGSR